MKALTVWQPLASLIMEGCKPFEFRRRQGRVAPVPREIIGQRIVIHAGQRAPTLPELRELARPERLASSCGIFDEIRQAKARDILEHAITGETILQLGAGLGTALIDAPVKCRDLWPDDPLVDPDMWAIPLHEPDLWDPPLVALGQQGFWNWNAGAVGGEDGSHRCHAIGCETPVPPKLLMCGRHWRLVPKKLQQEVWRHYRPGQETDKRASTAYLMAAKNAIDAVAAAEGRQPQLDLARPS